MEKLNKCLPCADKHFAKANDPRKPILAKNKSFKGEYVHLMTNEAPKVAYVGITDDYDARVKRHFADKKWYPKQS